MHQQPPQTPLCLSQNKNDAVAGFGPVRPSGASIPSIFSRSSASSSKSKTSKLETIRSLWTDFGITISPSCRCHRMIVWATDLPCFLAMRAMRRIVQQPAAAERAPAFDADVVPGMKVALVALLEARMEFDLVDHGGHSGLADDPFQVVLVEIRYADRFDPAGVPELDQRLPCLDIFALAGHRPVDQEQVDLLYSELLHRLVESAQRGVALMRAVAQLRGDEKVRFRGTPAVRIACPTPSSLP